MAYKRCRLKSFNALTFIIIIYFKPTVYMAVIDNIRYPIWGFSGVDWSNSTHQPCPVPADCPGWPALADLSRLTFRVWPVLSWLSCLGWPVPADLSKLTYLDWPVPANMSGWPVLADLRLTCAGWPVPIDLSRPWLSCFGICPGCPIPVSCPVSPVPGCHVLTVLSPLSFRPILAVMFVIFRLSSCPICPFPDVMSCLSWAVL